jgi:flavin-dependent dehydrogenase
MSHPVNIAGGGIAGLALGLALRREGVPVVLSEAGTYPRHRLCGEFLSGAGAEEFAALGAGDLLEHSVPLTDTAWFCGDRPVFRRELPEPAHGISRWRLDAALAGRFTALGGELRCEQRISAPPQAEGWVMATGRVRTDAGRWFAQKEHYQNLPVTAGLEMHLGRGGYAGLARVDDGVVNVCALLPAATGRMPATALPDRLRACGLNELAARLESASPVAFSRCGVARFGTGWQPQRDGRLCIGDHCAIIPPFAGHGLSMAIFAALEAAPLLAAWSAGRLAWRNAVQSVQAALRRKFLVRLRWAARLHPVLLHPAGHGIIRFLASRGLLPWSWLYQRLR